MTLPIQQYLPLNPMQVIKRYVFKNRFVTWLPGELPGMAKVSSKQVGILHRYVVLSLDLLPQSTWVVIALYLLQPVSKKALYSITELNDYQVIKKCPFSSQSRESTMVDYLNRHYIFVGWVLKTHFSYTYIDTHMPFFVVCGFTKYFSRSISIVSYLSIYLITTHHYKLW